MAAVSTLAASMDGGGG
ncbi:unnamed protein product, partial [Adineta steineri]